MVKRGSSASKGFTKAKFLVVVTLFLAIFFTFGDAVNNAKYQARDLSCQSNLRQIGVAVTAYRTSHRKQMPPTLRSLLPILGSQSVLVCPVSGTDLTPPYTNRSYTYRLLNQPRGDDIICWDSNPHRPNHSIFAWLNKACRNVLYADGRVKMLSEDQFKNQALQGANLILWRQ